MFILGVEYPIRTFYIEVTRQQNSWNVLLNIYIEKEDWHWIYPKTWHFASLVRYDTFLIRYTLVSLNSIFIYLYLLQCHGFLVLISNFTFYHTDHHFSCRTLGLTSLLSLCDCLSPRHYNSLNTSLSSLLFHIISKFLSLFPV